jgi:hypothetical protein
MTDNTASITIAGRTLALPLEQLHQILCEADRANSEALFTQAKLRRRTIAALRVSNPARYRELRFGGGSYWLGIGHQSWQGRTLPDILVAAARWLHDGHPEAFQRLSQRRKHTRAYIAQDPASLYGGRPHLASHAKLFAPGWYIDTNLSADNTQRFLGDLFAEAGLVHRRDWYFGRLD